MTNPLLWVLLLTAWSACDGTHVNISISQQHTKNAGHVSDTSMVDQAQFNADSVQHLGSNGHQNDGLSARIQSEDKDANHKVEGSNMNDRSDRRQLGQLVAQTHYPYRSMYESNPIEYQRNAQFRKMNDQQKQNMEFERYIHHYHSGPTVETVYESADAMPQHSSTSRVNEGSQVQRSGRIVKFERQVALPAASSDAEKQAVHAIGQHQPVQVSEGASSASTASAAAAASSTSSSSVPSVSVSAAGGTNLKININQRPASVGGDGLNFDQSTSYNKPNYNDPTNVKSISQRPQVGGDGLNFDQSTSYNKPNYNDPTNIKSISQRPQVGGDGLNFDQSTSYNKPNYNDPTNVKYNNDGADSHFYNQYPPTVPEPQGAYGGYFIPATHSTNPDNQFYGNGYGQPQVGGNNYLPPGTINQRPVVTKTIQIAQPAIKTKKYEVRHPAIQKEFYDIEERVIIKPAGTVVVELERPVAKIPKGESILPLGHPHPAIAGAYGNNGNTPSFSNIIYSAAGSSSQSQANNQYGPSTGYNPNQVPEHRATIGGSTLASSITSTPTFDQSSKEVAVEANLNKQYNGDNHFTVTAAPVVEEPRSRNREVIVVTDGQGNQRQVSADQFSYSRDETDRAPHRSGYNLRSYSNQNVAPQRSNYQPTQSSRNEYEFDAEYVNTGANGNIPRDSKPARLQEAPIRMEPVIKHEHNIPLPPSQHKIYLTQKHEVPQSRFIEGPAHVQEVNPHHLLNHAGPMIIYASNKQRPEVAFRQGGSEYQHQSQVVNFRTPGGASNMASGHGRLEISAPYAQMRYHPDDQAVSNHQSHNERMKFGKLILEEKTPKDMMSQSKSVNMTAPQTHIEINIPHPSQDSNKHMTLSGDGNEIHNSKLEISVTNNGEPKKDQMDNDHVKHNIETSNDSGRLSNSQDSPDCDKTSKMGQSQMEQKFMRIVEAPTDTHNDESSASESTSSNAAVNNVDIHNKGTSGHLATAGHPGHVVTPGSRVIAATPAAKDSSAGSESFHKRRIVVNHPFQTVREVVEHEPYTNYHEVQVNEPASPSLYHSAAYFQTHGSLRQAAAPAMNEQRQLAAPVYYH